MEGFPFPVGEDCRRSKSVSCDVCTEERERTAVLSTWRKAKTLLGCMLR